MPPTPVSMAVERTEHGDMWGAFARADRSQNNSLFDGDMLEWKGFSGAHVQQDGSNLESGLESVKMQIAPQLKFGSEELEGQFAPNNCTPYDSIFCQSSGGI